MTRINIKKFIVFILAGLLVTGVANGCGSSVKVIKSEMVKSIPDEKYGIIIRLDTPDGMPMEPDAGFVYIKPEGKVTTDFPREIFVKSLEGLNQYERLNRNIMRKYVIKDSRGVVNGYYEILPQYRAHLWERGDDILLQIITPGAEGTRPDAGGTIGVGGPVPGGR